MSAEKCVEMAKVQMSYSSKGDNWIAIPSWKNKEVAERPVNPDFEVGHYSPHARYGAQIVPIPHQGMRFALSRLNLEHRIDLNRAIITKKSHACTYQGDVKVVARKNDIDLIRHWHHIAIGRYDSGQNSDSEYIQLLEKECAELCRQQAKKWTGEKKYVPPYEVWTYNGEEFSVSDMRERHYTLTKEAMTLALLGTKLNEKVSLKHTEPRGHAQRIMISDVDADFLVYWRLAALSPEFYQIRFKNAVRAQDEKEQEQRSKDPDMIRSGGRYWTKEEHRRNQEISDSYIGF